MSATARASGTARITATRFPSPRAAGDLAEIVADAVRIRPPLYLQSIFGPIRSWAEPKRPLSEFRILNPRQPLRTLRYLRDASVPARPWSPPPPVARWVPDALTDLFWRPSEILCEPDPYGRTDSFPDEKWFFVNGVATNADVARLNARLIAKLFRRPVTLLQNATDSLLVDLYECAVGKGFRKQPHTEDRQSMTEPAWRAVTAVLSALNDPELERVIVLAHSQGTIIASNMLRAIARTLDQQHLLSRGGRRCNWDTFAGDLMRQFDDDRNEDLRASVAGCMAQFGSGRPDAVLARLRKLEVYTFANCADSMKQVVRRGRRALPWLEHFANENDIVARLGVLSPNDKVVIDGPRYIRRGAWGHLLNEHHLFPIQEHLEDGGSNEVPDPYPPTGPVGSTMPRLYRYAHGGRPRALAAF